MQRRTNHVCAYELLRDVKENRIALIDVKYHLQNINLQLYHNFYQTYYVLRRFRQAH